MSLREQALKGGAVMLIRQGLGILLSLVGVLVVTRAIGPYQYGLYVASYGILSFVTSVGSWGLDVYLLRQSTNVQAREYNQAFTLLLCFGTILSAVIILAQNAIALLLRLPGLAPILATLAVSLPLALVSLPALVQLDRALNFKRVAYIELASQISYYMVALPLALKGAGAWSPTSGFVFQQIIFLLLNYWSTAFRPRLCWNPSLIKKMLGYGFSYSTSIWLWKLRDLVNPVIVGRFAGPEAVAFVALSIRLSELLSFAKEATRRISLAALVNVVNDKVRLRNSIQEGMRLQVMAVGLPLATFAIVAPVILPLVFGKQWNPMLQVFPFVALSYLSQAIFNNLHASVLYLLHKNILVTWSNLIHIFLFIGSAIILVPRLGFIGYGWAEMCALFSYILLHIYINQEVGSPNYAAALQWYGVVIAMLVFSKVDSSLHYLALILPLLPLISASERSVLSNYAQLLRKTKRVENEILKKS